MKYINHYFAFYIFLTIITHNTYAMHSLEEWEELAYELFNLPSRTPVEKEPHEEKNEQGQPVPMLNALKIPTKSEAQKTKKRKQVIADKANATLQEWLSKNSSTPTITKKQKTS